MDDPGSEQRLAAEQRARVVIDRQLADAGWVVQDKKGMNLYAWLTGKSGDLDQVEEMGGI